VVKHIKLNDFPPLLPGFSKDFARSFIMDDIQDIIVSTDSFEMDAKTYLTRLGTIIDSDGYSNVRSGHSNKLKIISQIQSNTIFYFTPNSHNEWWKIESIDGAING